jgi:hypothetical protein
MKLDAIMYEARCGFRPRDWRESVEAKSHAAAARALLAGAHGVRRVSGGTTTAGVRFSRWIGYRNGGEIRATIVQ